MRSVLVSLLIVSGACSSHPFTGTRCQDQRTLETCTCSHEFDNCTCQPTVCDPGVCVSVEEGALCSAAASPSPECATVGTGRICVGAQLFACSSGYRDMAPLACDGVCVLAGGQAMCSVSAEPWPGCDSAQAVQKICGSDGAMIDCVYGYRRGITADRRGSRCSAGWHCVDNGQAASCVPDNTVKSSVCQQNDLSQKRCLGTTQVTCNLGYVVENAKCRSCQDGVCTGGLQAPCAKNEDCADGFTCLMKDDQMGECTAPCTGPELANPTCLSLEVDTSLPYNSIYGKCTAGFCRF